MSENIEPFDFSAFSSDLDQWQDLYDSSVSYPQNILNMTQDVLILPTHEVEFYPIVAAYLIAPSALCNVLPILCAYGVRGSGKSTLGKWNSVIHFGSEWQGASISPTNTFASIRNTLSSRKFLDGLERNTSMSWDDIDTEVLLSNPQIYQLLKVGYDRSTDVISIADTKGTNIDFRVFSPKVVSSIHPWFIDPRLNEIQRRCIVVKTEKLELPPSLISLEDFDWHEFNLCFIRYWQNKELCSLFIQTRKSLSRRNSKYKPLFKHGTEKWTISVDLITVLIVAYDYSPIDAIELFNAYYKWLEETVGTGNAAFLLLLKKHIDKELSQALSNRKALERLGIDRKEIDSDPSCQLTLDPVLLKRQITQWFSEGRLDMTPKTSTVNNLMMQLGYRLTDIGWENIK